MEQLSFNVAIFGNCHVLALGGLDDVDVEYEWNQIFAQEMRIFILIPINVQVYSQQVEVRRRRGLSRWGR